MATAEGNYRIDSLPQAQLIVENFYKYAAGENEAPPAPVQIEKKQQGISALLPVIIIMVIIILYSWLHDVVVAGADSNYKPIR